VTTTTITYSYDPLYRLKTATYSDGTSIAYTYDATGNRLIETTAGGVAISYVYDIANRLTSVGGVAYTWDAKGNLLSDGVRSYTYDHANRLTAVAYGPDTYSFAYSGLGDRLRQTVNGVPIEYTLDLAAGLTQVLSDGDNAYLYGIGRIGEQQPEAWQYHLGDALGSVRSLVGASGDLSLTQSYQPFGNRLVASGSVSSTFAFTGEQMDGTGLVYLRARYYAPAQGRFLSQDVWSGTVSMPSTQHPWLYALANPTTLTDPTGSFPEWCRSRWTKWGYAKCVLDYYHLEPAGSIFFNGDAVRNVTGGIGCWRGPIEYRGPGYLEGYSWFGTVVWGGKEIVYDFATMERSQFTYIGAGISDSMIGGGYALYVGLAEGLRSDTSLRTQYIGLGFVETVGADISLEDYLSGGLGLVGTTSLSDFKLRTMSAYVGVSAGIGVPLVDVGFGIVNFTESPGAYKLYYPSGQATMVVDILGGRESPYPEIVQISAESELFNMRGLAASIIAPYWIYVHEEMENERNRSNQ
jgi:RHS repeat-associated protein